MSFSAAGAAKARRGISKDAPSAAGSSAQERRIWAPAATAVVPTGGPPAESPAPAGERLFAAAKAAAKAGPAETSVAARQQREAGKDAALAGTSVPAEWVWYLVSKTKHEKYATRLAGYALFTAVFTAIFLLARPVNASFSIQDSILEQTTRERGMGGFSFYDIASDAEWFFWVQQQLVPTVMETTFFNGDDRAETWGGRFVNTVAMYNTQTAPMRFRQARVTDNSCTTKNSGSNLARPCWGEFSVSNQVKTPFGEAYGCRYLEDLSPIDGYGNAGHVVDVKLDKAVAASAVEDMSQGLWLNEQTRMVAIETSWYNANYDMSTYIRWQVEITPGGRFTPSVVTYACRLDLYSTDADKVRMGLEGVFLIGLMFYLAEEVFVWITACKRGKLKAHARQLWNWMEATNLVLYVCIIAWWATFWLKDKDPYKDLSFAVEAQRPDLSKVARHFDSIANLAAFNIVFSYLKVFGYLQVFPNVGMIWRALQAGFDDMWPFLVVFFLFTCGFAFAGHWIFGLMMEEFRTWTESIATLCLTLVGGFPYNRMMRVAPISASIFVCLWVLVVAMVLASVFIAILAEGYRLVAQERDEEESRMMKQVGHANHDLFRGFRHRLFCLCRRKADGDEAFREKSASACALLRRANWRDVDAWHKAVLSGSPVSVEELSRLFNGDLDKAGVFAAAVQALAATRAKQGLDYFQALSAEERDVDRVKGLQRQVEDMEAHVQRLRTALGKTQLAPAQPGQAQEGFLMEAFSKPPNSAEVWHQGVGATGGAGVQMPPPSEATATRNANARAAQEAAVLRTQKDQMERQMMDTERRTGEEMARLRIENARLQAAYEEADMRASQEFQRAVKELDEVNRLKLQLKALRESELTLQAKNAELERQMAEASRKAVEQAARPSTAAPAVAPEGAEAALEQQQAAEERPKSRGAREAARDFQQFRQEQDAQLERQRLAEQQSLQDRLSQRRQQGGPDS